MESHDNLVSNEEQKNMKKFGDEPLPENVYSLDSDESETQCFSDVHGACGDGINVNLNFPKSVHLRFPTFWQQHFHFIFYSV